MREPSPGRKPLLAEKALVGTFSVIVKTDGSFAALAWELHAERQLGVVDGELGEERQAVVLVREVRQVQVGGGEGDVLAGGGHAGVKLVSVRDPGSVPPAHRGQLLVLVTLTALELPIEATGVVCLGPIPMVTIPLPSA